MNYSGIIYGDTANGEGFRTTLFVSGCSLNCKDCHNKEEQDFNYGTLYTEETEWTILNSLTPPYVDGLTLSGGHPLEPQNIGTVTELCRKVKTILPYKTIWLYTGWQYEDIKDFEIMKYVDVVVDGRFVRELKDPSLAFRGSSNQRIIKFEK